MVDNESEHLGDQKEYVMYSVDMMEKIKSSTFSAHDKMKKYLTLVDMMY